MNIIIHCNSACLETLRNRFKAEHYFEVNKKEFLLSKNLDLKLFCVTPKRNNKVEILYNVGHLTICSDA